MRRHWKLLILAAVLVAAAGAGKVLPFIILTLLLPLYGLLWMSMFLIAFIILAGIVVPIGHRIIENREARIVEDEIPEEWRRAA